MTERPGRPGERDEQPRPYDVIKDMDSRDLTPKERFLMRLSDWSEPGAIQIIPARPEGSGHGRIGGDEGSPGRS